MCSMLGNPWHVYAKKYFTSSIWTLFFNVDIRNFDIQISKRGSPFTSLRIVNLIKNASV